MSYTLQDVPFSVVFQCICVLLALWMVHIRMFFACLRLPTDKGKSPVFKHFVYWGELQVTCSQWLFQALATKMLPQCEIGDQDIPGLILRNLPGEPRLYCRTDKIRKG